MADRTGVPEAAAAESRPLFESLAELNRVIHEPARLAILTVLTNCDSADFTFLENATGLTKGNLSVQLARLEKAALISIEKTPKKNRTITTLRILPEGRHQLTRYWEQMAEIRGRASAG